ncbi:hypothetical protein HDU81_000752 [Chytriomyces hyalinus]|nr:hypothetical protein HDU81_000752 [Chytriomyces hyalinus]
MLSVICALSNNDGLTSIEVDIESTDTVTRLKQTIRAARSPALDMWAAASLSLVRIFKERMSGGLTKAELRESKDGLHKATYGEDPDEAEDNLSTLHNIPGACLKKGLLFFKVMNSFKAVSTRRKSAPYSGIGSARDSTSAIKFHRLCKTMEARARNLSNTCESPRVFLHPASFTFLSERVMSNSRFGWIVGPPGCGKSVTSLAFVSVMANDFPEWTVTWIHLSKSELPVCVRFAKSQKWSISISAIDLPYLDAVLDDDDGKHVVFLDGFIHSDDAQMSIQKWCSAWRTRAREKRRLVVVCSTTLSGKSNIDDDTLNGVEEFVVDSWEVGGIPDCSAGY